MTMRILHVCMLVLLVAAAAYVYEIKFQSTLRAERVAKMRVDVRRERDAIAALRAEWATLENPARIQALARRHLQLRPADASQYDSFGRLPERPPTIVQPQAADVIADMIENAAVDVATGSVPPALNRR
jgi:cell division protein FtsL